MGSAKRSRPARPVEPAHPLRKPDGLETLRAGHQSRDFSPAGRMHRVISPRTFRASGDPVAGSSLRGGRGRTWVGGSTNRSWTGPPFASTDEPGPTGRRFSKDDLARARPSGTAIPRRRSRRWPSRLGVAGAGRRRPPSGWDERPRSGPGARFPGTLPAGGPTRPKALRGRTAPVKDARGVFLGLDI